MNHRPDWDIFCGVMYYLHEEARRHFNMFGDVLSDLRIPLGTYIQDVRYIVKRFAPQLHPDKNANARHNTPTLVDYLAAFTGLAVTIDAPLRYFFYFLELQALRMAAGIPEPRRLYRPNGELAVIPDRVLSTERNTMFAEARLHDQPDEFLPTRSHYNVSDVLGLGVRHAPSGQPYCMSVGRTGASAAMAGQSGSTCSFPPPKSSSPSGPATHPGQTGAGTSGAGPEVDPLAE